MPDHLLENNSHLSERPPGTHGHEKMMLAESLACALSVWTAGEDPPPSILCARGVPLLAPAVPMLPLAAGMFPDFSAICLKIGWHGVCPLPGQ